MKLLVIEDDTKTAKYLRKGLSEQGFVVDICADGKCALEVALSSRHDLVILDLMLPSIDGFSVLERLRAERSSTPVIIISGRDALQHRVRGLLLGADDYLVKPFSFNELLSRIRSVLSRGATLKTDLIECEDLLLDRQRLKASRAGKTVYLTLKEFQLLELLVSRRGEVMTRTCIAEMIWNSSIDISSNAIDAAVRRLRAKIDDPFPRKLIKTVRGRGYLVG